MIFRFMSMLFFSFTLFACNDNKLRRVIAENVIAEGNITNEGIYHGLIKFYDTATNQLVQTANYKAGILDGERVDYFNSGKHKLKLNYQNGKIIGDVIVFDSSGQIWQTQNRYFDLRVGSTVEYENGEVSHYYFYSLENEELFHINYDSVVGKRTEELNSNDFFFYHYNEYFNSESNESKHQLFLYLPNPPKFDFQYALCTIDKTYKIVQIIKELKSKEAWAAIDLDNSMLGSEESFAIRLTVDNQFDNDNRTETMLKRLSTGR